MSSPAIFISGLPTNVIERDVRRHFSGIGEVDELFLMRDSSGITGNAFVIFKSVKDQQTALTDPDSAKYGSDDLVLRY